MKIFIDFDGTLVDSISAICHMYNEDYYKEKNFSIARPKLVQQYNFVDQCTLLDLKNLENYFSSERFFNILRPLETKETLYTLNSIMSVTIVTIGTNKNISYKARYIEENYPGIKSIYLSQTIEDRINKALINMEDGILIDDYLINLDTSNAKIKYVYGPEREYNKTRIYNRIRNLKELVEILKNGKT